MNEKLTRDLLDAVRRYKRDHPGELEKITEERKARKEHELQAGMH